ncbi:UPF0262 family protein [Falsirhodobacter sp. 20TX0035]|uniref:UPF0262 family protein n=1 Tax=Falsirhodobacter sp. 20TX0035 TaxID=3022019 RepID=UPI00232F71BB|nr:UPF0262 family protein [Falsirhodobacter sp. 20TX0035]MDB6454880.1 UPF0262 family protein [Falsirhodobacter sp. 20TX0035]
MTRLSHVEIEAAANDDSRIAMADLLQDNAFTLPDLEGPYRLRLAMVDRRIAFGVTAPAAAREFHLSLGPFRQILKDYTQICNALAEAQGQMPPHRIEAIDMARRGIHNEGARLLQERLDGKAAVDLDTARRLFTLVCAMQR